MFFFYINAVSVWTIHRSSCRCKSHRSDRIDDFAFNQLSRDDEPKISSQQPQMFSHRASWVSGEIMINLLKWSFMDRIYLMSFLKLFGLCVRFVFSFCAMSESLRLQVRRPRPLSFNLHTLQSDKLSAVQTATRLIYSKLFPFVCLFFT